MVQRAFSTRFVAVLAAMTLVLLGPADAKSVCTFNPSLDEISLEAGATGSTNIATILGNSKPVTDASEQCNGDTFSLTLDPMPAWLKFDATTAVLSYTIPATHYAADLELAWTQNSKYGDQKKITSFNVLGDKAPLLEKPRRRLAEKEKGRRLKKEEDKDKGKEKEAAVKSVCKINTELVSHSLQGLEKSSFNLALLTGIIVDLGFKGKTQNNCKSHDLDVAAADCLREGLKALP